MPKFVEKPPLHLWKEVDEIVLFGDLNKNIEPLRPSEGDILMIIGPEKGFSLREEDVIRNKLKGTGIRLNKNTLRAETAALCALSLLND